MIYFLLLDRKKRRPAFEDDTEVIVRSRCGSQVRKRASMAFSLLYIITLVFLN